MEPAPAHGEQEPEAPRAFSAAERQALAEDVDLLVRLADRELDAETLTLLRGREPADWFALDLSGAEFDAARTLLVDGLAETPDPPSESDLDDLAAEYAAIHLLNSYEASPSESVWRDEDHLERQEAMFLAREWYARHGVKAPNWRVRADDHLVNELQFLALMLRGGGSRDDLREAARFLRDHLLVWTPLFADRVAARCRLQLYAAISLTTAIYLRRLGLALGAATGLDMTPPDRVFKTVKDDGPTCASPRELPPEKTPFNSPSW
jgi:TorA maturation chaperone TorD